LIFYLLIKNFIKPTIFFSGHIEGIMVIFPMSLIISFVLFIYLLGNHIGNIEKNIIYAIMITGISPIILKQLIYMVGGSYLLVYISLYSRLLLCILLIILVFIIIRKGILPPSTKRLYLMTLVVVGIIFLLIILISRKFWIDTVQIGPLLIQLPLYILFIFIYKEFYNNKNIICN